LNSPPPLFFIPAPISGTVSAGLTPFTHMCAQYLYYTHLPTPFLHLPANWYHPTPQGWTCSVPLLILRFCKRKKI
jgi:hypothetical protein